MDNDGLYESWFFIGDGGDKDNEILNAVIKLKLAAMGIDHLDQAYTRYIIM